LTARADDGYLRVMTRVRSGLAAALASLWFAAVLPAAAQNCTADQLALAVDQAGASLRKITAETQPRLEAKLKDVKASRGWTGADGDEQAYAAITDSRGAELDQTVNELLARVDQLGQLSAGAVPECGRITELEAAALELQAAVRARANHSLARLDALMAPAAAAAATPPPAPAPASPSTATPAPALPVVKAAPSPPPPAPQAQPAPSPWTTTTIVEAVPPAPRPDEDVYTIEDMKAASRGLFGQVSAGLGSIFEHAYAKIGRPAAYILGQETGGAFVAGLRYGRGTLYLRTGQSFPIYWHGPSLGADFGASGSNVMFLIYRMRDVAQLTNPFAAIEGSAYFAGGLGLTLMSNGDVQVAPIRSGVGLRLGASVGYIRFTQRPTWNPF
jgi:hypothetical protein